MNFNSLLSLSPKWWETISVWVVSFLNGKHSHFPDYVHCLLAILRLLGEFPSWVCYWNFGISEPTLLKTCPIMRLSCEPSSESLAHFGTHFVSLRRFLKTVGFFLWGSFWRWMSANVYFEKCVSCFANYPKLANSWSDVVRLLKCLFSPIARFFIPVAEFSHYKLSEKFQVWLFCSGQLVTDHLFFIMDLSQWRLFIFTIILWTVQSRFDWLGFLLQVQET